jgi:hypothetical protein
VGGMGHGHGHGPSAIAWAMGRVCCALCVACDLRSADCGLPEYGVAVVAVAVAVAMASG